MKSKATHWNILGDFVNSGLGAYFVALAVLFVSKSFFFKCIRPKTVLKIERRCISLILLRYLIDGCLQFFYFSLLKQWHWVKRIECVDFLLPICWPCVLIKKACGDLLFENILLFTILIGFATELKVPSMFHFRIRNSFIPRTHHLSEWEWFWALVCSNEVYILCINFGFKLQIDFWPKMCATQSRCVSNQNFLKLLEQKLNLGK